MVRRSRKWTCFFNNNKFIYSYICPGNTASSKKKKHALGIEPATSRLDKLRFPDNSSSPPLFVKDLEIKFCHTLYFYKNKQTVLIKRYKY